MPVKPQIDNSTSTKTFNVLLPLIVAISCVIGMLAGQRMGSNSGQNPLIQKLNDDHQIGVGRIEEVIRFIESKYVDEVNESEMVEDALSSIMKYLDPHSIYISKSRLEEVNNQLKGSYEGLGIETIFYKDTLVVLNVIKDGPSDKAGVQLFDKIINIGGDNNIAGEYDPEVLRSVLKGAHGSNNELVVKRHSTGLLDTINVAVGSVSVKSADIAYMIDDSIGYIKIERFNSNIYKEFMESLEMLHTKKGMKHLVVDVRDNPGGYLPETTKILSQLFLQKDRLLVYTEGKSDDRYDYHSSGKVFFEVGKIAVLIDEGSASGSEIIAGAIQDWDRGVIIGRRSYGKGLVQEQYGLKSGDALRLTVAKYYTPSGRSIQKPFDNDEEYSTELSDRSTSGEYMDASKIPVSDTTKYYTKIKHRVVYGGGGITPDIFIPKESNIDEDALSNIKQLIPEFAYLSLKDKLGDYPAKYKGYMDSELSRKSFVSEFESYLIKEEYLADDELPQKYYSRIDQLIKSKIVRILYDKINEGKFINNDDPFINESIKSINNRNILVELSEES